MKTLWLGWDKRYEKAVSRSIKVPNLFAWIMCMLHFCIKDSQNIEIVYWRMSNPIVRLLRK